MVFIPGFVVVSFPHQSMSPGGYPEVRVQTIEVPITSGSVEWEYHQRKQTKSVAMYP